MSSNETNKEGLITEKFKHFFKKYKSLKMFFVTIIMIFLFLLILTIFFCNYLVMNNLYTTINENYLSQYVITPMSNQNENFTQTLNIRIKVMEEILMESKLTNLKLMTEFVFKNDIQFETKELLDTNVYGDMTFFNRDILKNFYIGLDLSEKQSLEKRMFFYKKFKSLAYFFIFLQENYFIPYDISEILVIEYNKLNYLIYSEDLSPNKNLFIDILNNPAKFKETLEFLDKYSFVDYIVQNIYSEEENIFNYIKLHSLDTVIDNTSYDFIFVFRLKNKEMRKVFDNIGNNMTIVFRHDHFYSNDYSYNFLPISDYMESFVNYGISVNETLFTQISDLLSLQPKTFGRQSENYNISDLFTFKEILNNLQNNTANSVYSQFVFNQNFYNEFLVMGGLFNKILKKYFSIDFYDKDGVTLNSTECQKLIQISYSEMTCGIIEFDETNTLKTLDFGISFDNNTHENSVSSFYYNKTLSKKFDEAVYYEDGGIFTSSYGRTFVKKFLIYKSKLNNLEVISIDMVSIEQYYDIEKNFILEMQFYSTIITNLLVFFSFGVFIVSLVITIKSIDALLNRINLIRNIKTNLFYKDEFLHLSILGGNLSKNKANSIKINHLENIAKKTLNNEITEKEKFEMLEKDLFEEQLLVIICESKKKLNKVLHRVDNGKIINFLIYFLLETEPNFLERLSSFQRRYRLCNKYFILPTSKKLRIYRRQGLLFILANLQGD